MDTYTVRQLKFHKLAMKFDQPIGNLQSCVIQQKNRDFSELLEYVQFQNIRSPLKSTDMF